MTRESDETRAQLRRLVETQAAALREVTAQRDALRETVRRIVGAYNAQPYPCHHAIREAIWAARDAIAAATQ